MVTSFSNHIFWLFENICEFLNFLETTFLKIVVTHKMLIKNTNSLWKLVFWFDQKLKSYKHLYERMLKYMKLFIVLQFLQQIVIHIFFGKNCGNMLKNMVLWCQTKLYQLSNQVCMKFLVYHYNIYNLQAYTLKYESLAEN